MADQGKWYKLWFTSITDPDLEALPNELWAIWAKFGTYIKVHGNNGEIVIKRPSTGLCSLLKCSNFDELLEAIKCFPNVTVSLETNTTVSYRVKYNNWWKYQGDLSTERVHKYRKKQKLETVANETPQEEKRREEKRIRKEEKRINNIPPFLEEVKKYCLERKNNINPQKWFDFYTSKNWMIGKNKMKDWKAAVRTWEHKEKEGVTSPDEDKRKQLKADLANAYKLLEFSNTPEMQSRYKKEIKYLEAQL